MNESTLVPREEMSDLDWLARNVPKVGIRHNFMRIERNSSINENAWQAVLVSKASYELGGNWFTVDQWLARRAELQNKPSWKDAPEWAEWLAQDEDGEWKWLAGLPGKYVDGWTAVKIKGCRKGLALGDWRDTLEKRPADLSEQAVTARLNEATGNVLAAVPELMTDKYKFDPFVSAEDAATAKQHDPVSNPSHYASGGIECIEAIKASMSHEAFLGYLKGNVQKYMWRYEKKVNPAEDLKKARWYLDKLIEEQK